ncbi:hypothetical protein E2G85_21815 [Salmonella enterica subsp. enterica serovar Enteritidis]|nr:hypothetical protein [Salmonella enterica subsp. enterica serovar Enteritidis]
MMIKSKKVVVIFVALSSFLLAGCDSPKDANKQNFEKAINTRLEKECITRGLTLSGTKTHVKGFWS